MSLPSAVPPLRTRPYLLLNLPLLASLLAVLALLSTPSSVAAERPNIVLILADDMGYGDVQALNPESKLPTPHLDRLAGQGMTLTDAHTGSSVCTPTRYGLLTGRYCWRTRLKRGVLNGYGEPLIEPDRMTVAAMLQQAGYRTGVVGKWHLGLGFVRDGDAIDFQAPVTDGPNDHGFDYSYIIPASLDFPPYVYLEDGQVTDPRIVEQQAQKFPGFLRKGPRSSELVMTECLDHLRARAEEFIRRESQREDAPFFLYFPLTAPHKPVLPHPRYRGRTSLGPYGDFVHQVDDTVGRLLQTLDEQGLADDTLVIYTSDNGSYMYRRTEGPDHVTDPTVQAFHPTRHRANGPWRGTKADIWEAGHRVPFLARWPGRIEAGSTSRKTICLTDVFATLAAIADRPVPDGQAPDSFSFLPSLLGHPPGERPPVVHHSASGMFAVRQGPWKLVLGNGSGGRETPRGKPFERPYQLFHLEQDPGETRDLIEKHPAEAEALERALDEIRNGAP